MQILPYLQSISETPYSIAKKEKWCDLGTERQWYRWCNGESIPSHNIMKEILVLTRGQVQPNDWYENIWNENIVSILSNVHIDD